MKLESTCCWRRLDTPGADVCRVYRLEDGWLLRGNAVFFEHGLGCALRYEAKADELWNTRSAFVEGHCGEREILLDIRRLSPESWQLNGEEAKLAAPCLDVDLGFTPATNILALERMRLAVGESLDCHSAWLDFPGLELQHLPQIYRRIDAEHYDYESPTAGYRGRLRVMPGGVVALYPELFELVSLERV
jgi:hypothetical protein